MIRFGWLMGVCVWLMGMSACGAVERPNFIVVFADDLGYGDVGCYGSSSIPTPTWDKMAEQGMRFTSFYAQPICGPSRSALLTGCYPMRVAEKDNVKNTHPVLHDKEITIAEVLKTKGYATCAIGKWDQAGHKQVGFDPALMPNHQGFDYFFGTPSSNDKVVHLYRNAELVEKGADMAYLTRRYTDEAVGFIEKHKADPFFIYLPHTMPHTKLAASPDFVGKTKRGLYGDVLAELDHSTGRIWDAVRDAGIADRTYLIFTSDNGPWLLRNKGQRQGVAPQDHGGSALPLRSGKVSTWEGGIRVPMIVVGPDVPAGSTCKEISSTMDLLPTFAAMAGAEVPSDRVIDGEDVTHLWHGQFDKATGDKTFFGYMTTELQTVRRGPWKLHLPRGRQRPWQKFAKHRHIHSEDNLFTDQPLLFNLHDDLGETTDVAAKHPQVVRALLTVAEAARNDIGDYDRIGSGQRFFDDGSKRMESDKWLNQ